MGTVNLPLWIQRGVQVGAQVCEIGAEAVQGVSTRAQRVSNDRSLFLQRCYYDNGVTAEEGLYARCR